MSPTVPTARPRSSFASTADVDQFFENLRKFESGEMTPEAWRTFRLINGTYGQRQDEEHHMLRCKIPQGILTPPQLRAVAQVAEKYSRGFAHITTRQNFQLHFVKLHDVEPAMRILSEAGITNREACGNSVRNITACHMAGVSPTEIFDVTPYAEATTRYLLRHPMSSTLPRKFKIAFEGCAEDHALTSIHDIGVRARVRTENGRTVRGFRIMAGGGTATLPRSAQLLVDFLPAGELLLVVEAILSVFNRLGDRQRRQSNRMKFLIRNIGWDTFKAEVEKDLAAIRQRGPGQLPFDPNSPPVEEAPTWPRPPAPSPEEIAKRLGVTPVHGYGILPVVGPDEAGVAALAAWMTSNVRKQRQPGYAMVTATVTLGDLTSDQLRIVADLARSYADGLVRVTLAQNLLFRWVPEGEVGELFRRLAAAGLGKDAAETVADVISCPGAESCKLAVTASRGVGQLIEKQLRARPDLVAATRDLAIKVSGCPNGCSQHHIAGIGLQGSARKLDGKPIPQYFVLVGGGTNEDNTARFGRLAAKIPARRVPAAFERLVELFKAEGAPGETATAFFARVPVEKVKATLADLADISSATATPEDYIDPGEDHAFVPETSEGECAA